MFLPACSLAGPVTVVGELTLAAAVQLGLMAKTTVAHLGGKTAQKGHRRGLSTVNSSKSPKSQLCRLQTHEVVTDQHVHIESCKREEKKDPQRKDLKIVDVFTFFFYYSRWSSVCNRVTRSSE